MTKNLKRYAVSIILIIFLGLLFVFDRDLGVSAIVKTKDASIQAFLVFPPIMILLGLMDVWVKKETMIKYMGKGSGIKGTFLAFLLGSVAAGPLFVAFPVSIMLLKKGVSWFNIFILLGAWSTTKIPMFLFEISSMGPKFAFLRLGLDVVAITTLAWLMDKTTRKEDKEKVINKIVETK